MHTNPICLNEFELINFPNGSSLFQGSAKKIIQKKESISTCAIFFKKLQVFFCCKSTYLLFVGEYIKFRFDFDALSV